jgi:predicted RNA binding protein YcfA (HicA-like mRNA interferase family)
MKIPRDCNAGELSRALRKFGYAVELQTGSHIIFTTQQNGEHHVTVPNHRPIKAGTLQNILKAVAAHHKMTVEDLLREFSM